MDKSAVVRDIKQRTGFKSCSDKVCCNCVYVDNNEQYGLECTLNPVYPFGVQPFNTCAEFKKTSMDISIY